MNRRLLKRIGNAPGVPGFENAAQDIAAEVLGTCCDEVTRDRLGNVIGLKKATIRPKRGSRPIRLMIAAHADEVGLMVKHINGKGLIHFIPMGGVSAVVAQSQRVIIHGKKHVRGVIVPKGNGKDDKPAQLTDLFIDTGLPKEKLEKLVSVGDIVTFDSDVSLLNDKMWVGRNFDDRIGSYTLLEAMRTVGDTHVDVYAVSAVQ